MKFTDIEKFARENRMLSRFIADFNCRTSLCSECVFNIKCDGETRCLSATLEAIISAEDSFKQG